MTERASLTGLLRIFWNFWKHLEIELCGADLDDGKLGGAICFNGEGAEKDLEDCKHIPTLSLPSATGTSRQKLVDADVVFANDENVPFPFRNLRLSTKVAEDFGSLRLRSGERVLASIGNAVIWSVHEACGNKRFRSALSLPGLGPADIFADLFNGENFLGLLPVFQFLRDADNTLAYVLPGLRASFIIDDPNLHAPTYGRVNFSNIAESARDRGYHVGFATIPLDTWYTHKGAAETFRRSEGYLSLLFHGNNHSKRELARRYSSQERIALLQQGEMRVRRLEARAGVRVCRVMVPPHGACSHEMLADLPRWGFESACISAGSLRAHNRTESWTRALGFAPCELVRGCAVLPRWSLTGKT